MFMLDPFHYKIIHPSRCYGRLAENVNLRGSEDYSHGLLPDPDF